jgi:hypothetical protein
MYKYKAGDKFVIEIEEVIETQGKTLHRVKGFNALVFDEYGLGMLEQIKETKEAPKLTQREKSFVEYAQTGWIARDKDGRAFIFTERPYKSGSMWKAEMGSYTGFKDSKSMFSFIKYEDEKPWSIEELKKLEVQDE